MLVAHGESGRSRVGAPGYRPTPDSPQGQFELPFGTAGPMTLLSLGALVTSAIGANSKHLA